MPSFKCEPDLFVILGKPPVTQAELAPFVPDQAGEKLDFWTKLRIIPLAMTRGYGIYKNRPSLGAAKGETVSPTGVPRDP